MPAPAEHPNVYQVPAMTLGNSPATIALLQAQEQLRQAHELEQAELNQIVDDYLNRLPRLAQQPIQRLGNRDSGAS